MSDQTPATPDAPVSVRDYIAVIRLRKWSIVLLTSLTVGASLLFSLRQTPLYTSSARVLVRPIATSPTEPGAVLPVNLETERGLAASVPVARRVLDELDLTADAASILEGLEVEVLTGSEFLLFKYEHSAPLQAQRLARGFSTSYLDYRRDQAVSDVLAAAESVQQRVESVQDDLRRVTSQIEAATTSSERLSLESEASLLTSQLAVLQQNLSDLTPSNLSVGQIVEPASIPSSPSSPDYLLNIGLAAVLGLGLGVGLAFVRERLDDRLRGRQDVEMHAGAPVLAVIPEVGTWRRKKQTPVISVTEPRSAASEAYRTLRTALTFLASQEQRKVFMITSAHPDEGKTATVANLAVALAQAGKRVIAISADLRKPRLHKFLSVSSNGAGLTNVLAGEAEVLDALSRPGVESLRLLGSGPVPGNPNELLGSDRMGQIIDELRQISDFVLIDTAPVLAVADALTLSPFADAVLLVADAQKTTRGSLAHARQELDQVDAKVVGAVLNNFDPSKVKGYQYQYYYVYRYQQEPKRGRKRADQRERAGSKNRRGF